MTPRPTRDSPDATGGRSPLPRAPAALLRALLPYAERDEVLDDLSGEYHERARERGAAAARGWLWRQVLGSVPSLLRRSWWRGWSGFEPRANRMRPGGPMLEGWIMDMRYAARRLRTRPMYSLLAILTLALGVGGTAAIYGVVRDLLVEPLPYRDQEELAVFWMDRSWSEEEFLFLRGQVPGFRQVASYRTEDLTLQGTDGPPRLLAGLASSAELFQVLGASPVLGPGFRTGDDAMGAEPVTVLSYGLWQELGGDPSIIGTRLRLDGAERTVVGVMPRGFWFPDPDVRVWVPAALNPEGRSGRYTFIGRVAPGHTVENMGGPLAQLTALIGDRFDYPPDWDKTKDAAVTPVKESLVGSVRPALLATLAAMGLILLIACANVGALVLGQVEGRSSELAVRSAMGADRRRLTQQLVAEAILLGVCAGIAGALVAAGTFGILVAALPLGALAETASLDWTVFAAAMAIAMVAALLVALAPTISLARGDLRDSLTRARTGGVGGRSRLESGLVVTEVALAVIMAAGAALLIRSVTNLYAVDPGVETRGIAVVHIATPSTMQAAERRQALGEVVRALGEMPGVRSAAAVQRLPLSGGGDNWGIAVVGRPELEQSTTSFRIVTRDYFDVMGIAIREGRGFDVSDRPDGALSVVINEALAKKYFPDVNPIGRRISTGFNEDGEVIVGIVENIAEAKLTDEAAPARYMLYDQLSYTPEGHTLVIALEREGNPAAMLDAARRTIRTAAPGVAIQEMTTMERVFDEAVGPARQVMTLLTLLTALALTLGAIGVYGVISHFVSRRKRDWGIRVALGLRPSRVIGQVVARGGALVAMGAVLGIVGAVALSRVLASFLYGVGATDPLALAGATAALLAVGLLAAFIPAHRASRVDPATVLREQ